MYKTVWQLQISLYIFYKQIFIRDIGLHFVGMYFSDVSGRPIWKLQMDRYPAYFFVWIKTLQMVVNFGKISQPSYFLIILTLWYCFVCWVSVLNKYVSTTLLVYAGRSCFILVFVLLCICGCLNLLIHFLFFFWSF